MASVLSGGGCLVHHGEGMQWFKPIRGEAVLPWPEWGSCRKDAQNLGAMEALGRTAYREAGKASKLILSEQAEAQIDVMAHLLHHCFLTVDENHLDEMVRILEGKGEELEDGFWESPQVMDEANAALLRRGRASELLETAFLGCELERRVQPGILRLAWTCHLSAGMPSNYEASQHDGQGRKRPMRFATSTITSLLDANRPDFLSGQERTVVRGLVKEVCEAKTKTLDCDELMAAILGRRYWVLDGVRFESPSGVDLIGLRKLRNWRRAAFRTGTLMSSFKVMFLAHVAYSAGGMLPEALET